MDWSAKLLGLGDDFLLSSKKGGGLIQVGGCRVLSLVAPPEQLDTSRVD